MEMTSTEEILKEIVDIEEESSKLEEEAKVKAAQILEDAKSKAEKIISDARKDAESQIDKLIREEESKSKDLLAQIDQETAAKKEALREAQKAKGNEAVKVAMELLLK